MVCFFCYKPIRGADLAHRYEWRRQPDGSVKVYGEDAPDGKLASAQGRLVKASHGKCYHAAKKQEELTAARAADPESQPREDTDWRHQEIVDLEDLAGEGH